MKISVESWHYRLLKSDWLGHVVPNNLCLYFWAVIYKLVGSVVLGCLGFLFAAGLYLTLFSLFSFIIWPIIFSYSTWVLLGSVAVIGLVVWKANNMIKNAPEGSAVSVTTEYVKAKKSKICPNLEFNRGEDDD